MSFGFGHRFGSKSIADRSIRGRVAIGPTGVGSERFDGDEMAADADDGDAGHPTRTYMTVSCPLGYVVENGYPVRPSTGAVQRQGRRVPRLR
jgi:hypothetical protein